MKWYTILTILTLPTWSVSIFQQKTGGRIVGGRPADYAQFPFTAAITVQTSNSRFFCGGTLFSSSYILTAGHCVDGAELFTVKLGTHLLNWGNEWSYENTTSGYILHPDYDATTLSYDLGLIPFIPPMMHTEYLFYVGSLQLRDLWPDEPVEAMGWGQLDDETDSPVNALHYAMMSTISNEQCKVTYGDQITDDMICAVGDTNQGTCVGDSGSPLIQQGSFGRQILVGVAIFVSGNGCQGIEPSGFVRIYSAWEWLYNVTGRLI